MPAALNLILDRLEDRGQLRDPDALFDAFSGWAASTGRTLYPHQEEAFLELLDGKHVVAATPTGSGKSMIALAAHFLSLARGGRSYYTAPLKALVSEKFFDLVALFGGENVGMVTGDVSLNAGAPLLCCTAEILANQALRDGDALDADTVVMDEFHFYGDPQRGWAWQVPLLELRHVQFVAMSATLGDTRALREEMHRRTGREVALIDDAKRPVPLDFDYCVDDLATVVSRLVHEGRTPVYVVHFSQREAVATARAFDRSGLVDKAGRARIAAELRGVAFARGFGQTLRGLLLQGIGVHHAGMLPRYRRLVERLTQRGLLAVVSGTDTLGVGINVPIRTVLFTSLVKFDGRRERHLTAREFHQIAGRAGRAGFDTAGFVRVLASPNELERAKAEARLSAEQSEKARQRLAKRQSRKRQAQHKTTWTRATYERLRGAAPEPLQSHFQITHAMVLNVLAGPGDPAAHLLRLATDNDDPHREVNPHLRRLADIYRSLRVAGIVEHVSSAQAGADGRPRLRLVGDLPDDFALNAPLSPFALAALDLLDPESDTYALDVVSVVEAVLEDPRPLLFAQQRAARDRAMAEMKAEGLDYAARMDQLEDVTWPKPLAGLLEPAFEAYRRANPWVGAMEISPKSVVRQMVERAMTFTELVSRYDAARSEGVVLRYLSDAYRALHQIVPESALDDELRRIIEWLGALIRSVDSSLLDEWEALSSGRRPEDAREVEGPERAFGADAEGHVRFTANPHALRTALRNALFRRVELMSRDDVEGLARLGDGWDRARWDRALGRYWDEHQAIGIDQRARSPELARIDASPTEADLVAAGLPQEALKEGEGAASGWWLAEQTIDDPEGDHDWRIEAAANLSECDRAERVVLHLLDVGPR